MNIYSLALVSGVSSVNFWSMTYSEVIETIDAYTERKRQEWEMQAGMYYTLANLIGIAFNDPKKFPRTLKDAYPFVREPARRGTWQESKAEFAAIAAAHNRSLRG